jgi:hypothetical protein
LFFTSTAPLFRTELLLSKNVTSRTYSFYYPRTRPLGRPRCLIVSSTNANYADWAKLSDEEYEASKRELIEGTLEHLNRYVPNIREPPDHVEAATPKTFGALHAARAGRELGTKFEGLAVSRGLPEQIRGCTTLARRHLYVGLAYAINYGGLRQRWTLYHERGRLMFENAAHVAKQQLKLVTIWPKTLTTRITPSHWRGEEPARVHSVPFVRFN